MFGWFKKQRLEQTEWTATAYLVKSRVVINSSSRTTNNIGWYNQPVFAVDIGESDARIGQLLRQALEASSWESAEDDSELKVHPILREADVPTWRKLGDQSKCVTISTDRQVVAIFPARWVSISKSRGYLGPSEEKQIRVNWNGTDSELGAGLRQAFEVSESKPNPKK